LPRPLMFLVLSAAACAGDTNSRGSQVGSELPIGSDVDSSDPSSDVRSSEENTTSELESGAASTSADAPWVATLDPASSTTFLWLGFEHEWLRRAFGFKVPHRISKLDSFIQAATVPSPPDSWSATATFRFGQSTGVDGNYQKPVGRYGVIDHPDLTTHRGSTAFTFTDESDRGEYPQARTSIRQTIALPGLGDAPQATLLLQGMSLDTSCDDAKQPEDEPCNSNGMWPFRFHIGLGDCEPSGPDLHCPVEVDVFRAWTPNLGGVPPFEIKPFNHALDYDLEIFWTVVSAPAGAVAITPVERLAHQGNARTNSAGRIFHAAPGVPGLPAGIAGLRGWGFDFIKSGTEDRHNHLGRYIGTLDFGIDHLYTNPENGFAILDGRCQVWIPDTVVETDYACHLDPVILQFDHRAIAIQDEVSGSLCINSSDQAPRFSRWEKCGGGQFGPEQDEDTAWVVEP
jgi:hypothetical protein